jgi:hypothetical protein
MKFDELPRETQERIMMIGHLAEIEVEDDKRRQSTRLGYRLGGTLGLTIACFGMVFATGFAVIGVAIVAPSLDTRMSTSPLFWLCFLPMALIPILPFLFLKLRYALKGLAIVVAILVVVGLLAGLGTWIEGAIVHALV